MGAIVPLYISILVNLAYLITLLLITAFSLKSKFLILFLKKTRIFELKYNYYIIPAFICSFFFIIASFVQLNYFEQVYWGQDISYFYGTTQRFINGSNPYQYTPPTNPLEAPLVYGPVFPILFAMGLLLYNHPFTIAIIIWMFFLGSVLLGVKHALINSSSKEQAVTIGVILALNPLLWNTAITLMQDDIIVTFSILLISYLFLKSGRMDNSILTRDIIVIGIITGIFSSIKIVLVFAFIALLLAKSQIAFKNKIAALAGCLGTFLPIHMVAYYFYGLDMIRYAYLLHSSSNMKREFYQMLDRPWGIDFSTSSLLSNLGIINVDNFQGWFFVLLILFAYIIIKLKKLRIYPSLIILMVGFFLGGPVTYPEHYAWFIPIPFLYSTTINAKSKVIVPSFFIILIARLWMFLVSGQQIDIPIEPIIVKSLLILGMDITLLILAWQVIKIESNEFSSVV